MRYVEANKCEVIPIGRQGENEVETVKFDVSGWSEKYGNGTFTLLHQRSKDTAPYECPIEVNEETVNWTVRNTDTAYGGLGEAQLIYTVNEAVAKSVIFETKTYNSLDGNVVFPDPYDDWLGEIHNDAEYVREHIDDAAEAEAWAVGERQGVPVGTDDPTYHNNAKHYALSTGTGGFFRCVYGVTTYDDISDALEAGLMPYVETNDASKRIVLYTNTIASGTHFFSDKIGVNITDITVNRNNRWNTMIAEAFDITYDETTGDVQKQKNGITETLFTLGNLSELAYEVVT